MVEDKEVRRMKVTLLFPGQGCQYIGMCRDIMVQFPQTREILEEANAYLGYDLGSMIMEGNMKELTRSDNAQPAVITASYILYLAYNTLAYHKPSYMVGHSLGEISALVATGAMDFGDALVFARKRGKIMQRALEEQIGRAGVVVDVPQRVLENMIHQVSRDHYITLSGYNSPEQWVVAGTKEALYQLDELVDQEGGQFIPFRMIPMKADAPYHSSLMEPYRWELEEALDKVVYHEPTIPVVSTVTGQVIDSKEEIGYLLSHQLVKPVLWNQVLTGIRDEGIELMVDLGPSKIMKNLVEENKSLPTCLGFDYEEDRKKLQKIYSNML